MSVSEIFFQSAVINALIFLWIASAVSATRILVRCEQKITRALMLSVCFGPLAFLASWIIEVYLHDKLKKTGGNAHGFSLDISSGLSIIIVLVMSIASLYFSFIKAQMPIETSSENLLINMALLLMAIGMFGGIILAAMTRRVAFFESSWCAFLLAFYFISLDEWAQLIFPYGLSTAYFTAVIICGTSLFLFFLTLGGSVGYLIFGEGHLNFRFGYESFIGSRFLMSKRGSQVVSLITFISVFAVMIACSGMIVVMSVMNGFSSDLRSKILGANAHLMVLKYGNDFTEYEEVMAKTRDIHGVSGISPFILNEGMISSKKNLSGAIITGIDVELASKSGRLLEYVTPQGIKNLKNPAEIEVAIDGSLSPGFDEKLHDMPSKINDLPGVIIGKEMAGDLQVFVGDVVNIISPVGEMGPTGPIPKAKQFRLAGLFYSGMYEYDAKFAYINLSDAQDFFNLKGSVSGVEYRVNDIEKTRSIAKEIDKAIGGYPFYSRDWMQMNRPMFSALQLEKIAMLIILGTLIFMASLLILVTLVMVVMEKGKDIAILKSMGATDASIMKIFVTYGLFVGGLGAVLGGSLGLGVCLMIEKIGIRLDADIYYFSNLPVRIVFGEVFFVVLSAILISFLATIPPSLFAARLKPVDGLRYE